jgi:membrane-associated phospholipid phosphatase
MSDSTEGTRLPFSGKRWLRAFALSVGIMLLSGVLAGIGSYAIQALYPDRPRPPDLLFDLLPYAPSWQYVVEATYVAGAVLLAVHAFRRVHWRQIPEYIALFGLMEIGRALIIVMTPLATPYDAETHFTYHESVRNWGEFPSGHAATMLLFYMIVDRDGDDRGIKWVLAVLLVVQVVAMLVSHSHYSIDIVGGLLLGYFVFRMYHDTKAFAWLRRLLEV